MLNALTVDVEDYFHVSAFNRTIGLADWDRQPLRVVENTRRVMNLLDEFQVKGTFFILGWVAEKCPALVREIDRRGHEIACHGFKHELLYEIGPARFRADLRAARDMIESISGKRIDGYRAPSFSVTRDSLWAVDIIIEEGFRYDSSIFPVRHDIYGLPGAEPYPHEITRPSGVLKEFPPSTLKVSFLNRSFRLPVSGGGYLRFFPLPFIKMALERINSREGQPAVLYFHPWELDPDQPRIKAGFKSRLRHYHNLDKTAGRLRCLLSSFSFAPMGKVLGC